MLTTRSHAETTGASGRSALIVESSHPMAMILSAVIAQGSLPICRSIVTRTAAEAETVLTSTQEIGLVLADCENPEDAPSLIAHARVRGIPVVVVSPAVSPAAIERLLSMGIAAFVRIPFHSDHLRDELANALASSVRTPPPVDSDMRDDSQNPDSELPAIHPDLTRCLTAAALEVLSTHYHAACEPASEEPITPNDEVASLFYSFRGTARGTLHLTAQKPIAHRLASSYCSDPVDVQSSLDDLLRMICGSTLHRFCPTAEYRFVREPLVTPSVTEAASAQVSLRLFEGLIHLGIAIADQSLAEPASRERFIIR